jgi:hypothetical protein
MTIKFIDAAKYYTSAQHQIDAWNWLQTKVSPEILNIFASKYREAMDKKKSKRKYLGWNL